MWQICNAIGEVMRWLQTDAALGELLCDKALKLHAGEIRPLSGGWHREHMFPLFFQFVALSVHSFRRVFKCLLWEHILCVALAVVLSRDPARVPFSFWHTEKRHQFSSICAWLFIAPWMTAFSNIWVMVTQAKAICGISETALIEGGLQDHISPLL